MASDISKKVVLVMLVLAIVLSVTGTWLVLDNIQEAGTRASIVESSGTGNVELDIVGKPPVTTGEATVSLTIK